MRSLRSFSKTFYEIWDIVLCTFQRKHYLNSTGALGVVYVCQYDSGAVHIGVPVKAHSTTVSHIPSSL